VTERKIKRVPPRLMMLYTGEPLYFVTFNTMYHRALLADERLLSAFRRYAETGTDRGVAVGRFVLMPDHVHMFVRVSGETRLGVWIKGLKRVLGSIVRDGIPEGRVWQPGFFDHVLRSSESYLEKWKYVRMNPVRKGLVDKPEDWPYQGEIVRIDRV